MPPRAANKGIDTPPITLQPETPSRKHAEINDYIRRLNAIDPRLKLRIRSLKESPGSRRNTPDEICQDLIIQSFFCKRLELDSAIQIFEFELRQNHHQDPIARLRSLLPFPERNAPRTGATSQRFQNSVVAKQQPIPRLDMISPPKFSGPKNPPDFDRPKTPVVDSDEEDSFGTPPETPSGLSRSAGRPSSARKRGPDQDMRVETATLGSAKTSFDISFASTRAAQSFGLDGVANPFRSFGTDITALTSEDSPVVTDTAEMSAVKRRKLENCHYQIKRLRTAGLFCDDEFPEHLARVPIRQAVEGTRIALQSGLAPYALLDTNVPDYYDQFHNHCVDKVHELVKADAKIMNADRKAFDAAIPNAAGVLLKLRLEFSNSAKPEADQQVFRPLIVKPLSIEKSDRFRRAFGWDRIACVDIAAIKNAPQHIKTQRDSFLDALNEWLDPRKPKKFLGRVWNVIHVKFLNAGKKARKEEQETLCRVFLFASSGCNLVTLQPNPWRRTNMDYIEAIKWFLPLSKLQNQPWAKTASRIDLAFSTTIPTIVIPPSQVRQGTDILADDTPESTEYLDPNFLATTWSGLDKRAVMNDGCARISLGALQLIMKHLNELGYALQTIPTAIQARFNGAKGVWYRSCSFADATEDDWKVWIEVTPSQRKFPQHDEDTDQSYDPLRFTFEVLKWTAGCTSSALNLAFIPILEDRGVELDVLKSVASDQIRAEECEILEAIKSPQLLLQWVYRHFSVLEKRRAGGVVWSAGMPRSDVEKLVYFIQHGMHMEHYPFLVELFSKIVVDYFSKVVQSMSIRMPESTMIIGIADPFGILMPGEIFAQFSTPLTDENNLPVTTLAPRKVIVARHPSLIPSDMQAFKAVWRPQFRDYYDVIIFSSRGHEPGASKLQGGDYDGDIFWVCFSTLLTRHFSNAIVPMCRPGPEYFGIEEDRRTVGKIMGSEHCVSTFLHTSLKFRGESQMLGQTTKHFERLAYTVRDLHNPGVQIMASMHHLLIDSNKSGFRYNETTFRKFVAGEPSIQPKKLPSKTAYEAGMEAGIKSSQGDLQVGAKQPAILEHSVDIIFYAVIIPALKGIWKNLFAELTFPRYTETGFKEFLDYAASSHDNQLQAILKSLDKELWGIHTAWNHGMTKKDSAARAEAIERCHARFLAYEPSAAALPGVQAWLRSRLPGEPPSWLLIKAARLYELIHVKPRTNFMFHIAGRQLAYLRAMSLKDTETTIAPIFSLLKPGKVSPVPLSSQAPTSGTNLLAELAERTENELSDVVAEHSADSIDDDDFYSTCAFMYDDGED